jgi:hypothetical protein
VKFKFLSLMVFILLAVPLGPARAAGHAHIVDDADVETPGTCHLELWTTNFLNGDGFGNAAPACTMKSLPFVELGAGYAHYWGQAISAPVFGPQIKVRFSPPESGVALGVGLNGGVNLHTGNFETGSIIGLMTVPIDKKVTLNVNAGWSYLRYVDRQNAFFYGAQFEAKVGGDVLLMIESFGRVAQAAGVQMGLRYTPNDGPIDFDFMVGSLLDSVNQQFITFGVTLRF